MNQGNTYTDQGANRPSNQKTNTPFMPNITPPVIITAAMFVSFIFLDLARNEYNSLPPHIILGIISTLLISVICEKGYSMVAWGLLTIPFIIILVGWTVYQQPTPTVVPATQYVDAGKFAQFSGKRKCSKRNMV